MEQEILLSAKNLRTWFELRRMVFARIGFVRAVDGVSFDLKRGEAIAIVGESGCGKSTLARTILGLHPPTEGEMTFAGEPLIARNRRVPRWYRREVGYIQQDPYGALLPFMNVRRILCEPLIVHGIKDPREQDQRIRAVLEAVKLTPVDEYQDKFPHMLSGGQQQRVVIARAKILNPQLLVADEPVSMLDASVRVEILQLLRTLQQTHGLSVIYITHDLSTVRHFAERIMVMYGGKIIEQAKVADLLDDTRHPYTKALLTAISDPDPANTEKFKTIPAGEPPSLLHPPPGCRFHPRCANIIKGLCDVDEPPEFEPTPGHRVACWLEKSA